MSQAVHFPAPVGGLNAIDPASAVEGRECVVLWNMLAAEYGLRSRLGYRKWAKGLTGSADNLVRTIIPFHGSQSSKDRLFAVTSSDIWDVTDTGSTTTAWATGTTYAADDFVTANGLTFGCVSGGTSHASAALPSAWAALTAYVVGDRVINGSYVYICTGNGTSAGAGGPTGTGSGISDGTVTWAYESAYTSISDNTVRWAYQTGNTVPTSVRTFATQTGDAGYGMWTQMLNASGDHFLAYCDEVNGYSLFTESTDSWGAGGVTGPTNGDADLVFPIVFKSNLWFVEKNTSTGWYLPTSAVTGAATHFYFGHKFKYGGNLVGLWSWTLDGGAGPDDHLVAVSSGGDVLVYALTDPTDYSTIFLKGSWYLGGLPKYRRIATEYGGDLLFLTKNGVVPLSRLVAGALTAEPTVYQTQKISNLFNSLMLSKGSKHGWSIKLHPEDNALMITVPTDDGAETQQLVQAQATKGWSRYSDLPIYSSDVWNGKMYFGDTDGAIYINDGYVDNVLLASSSSYEDITFDIITAFANFGSGLQKQGQEVRTHWLCDGGTVQYKIEGRYNFDMSLAATPDASANSGSVWDTAVWDTATWQGDYAPLSSVRGIAGMGTHVALAVKGKARSRTVLVGFDLSFTLGGFH